MQNTCKIKDLFGEWLTLYHTVTTFNDSVQQEGQDGPGSLTWFFEIALANFFLSLLEKNLQEFLNNCTVQEASIH